MGPRKSSSETQFKLRNDLGSLFTLSQEDLTVAGPGEVIGVASLSD